MTIARPRIISSWLGSLMIWPLMALSACTEQSALGPQEQGGPEEFTFARKIKRDGLWAPHGRIKKDFPRSASKIMAFLPELNMYKGGTLKVARQGSNFHVFDGSLTPPLGFPSGQDVTITMEVDYSAQNKELQFTFGPSGCHFDPPARIKVDYEILGIDDPTLFFIDSAGNYVEQTPDHMDTKKRFLFLYVDHFSRYAVGWGGRTQK